jgi:phosphoglycolate phosphatase
MSKVVLFDIDGTLILSGGAGVRAMNRACADLTGLEEVLAGVPVAGRTDWIILHDAMRKVGRDLDGQLFEDLKTRYLAHLTEEIEQPGRGVKGVMPGIRELLERLDARGDVFLGLLTGNIEGSARIKLEHFGLWRYFRCGAFGDDAADRNALVPIALQRVEASGLTAIPNEAVFVVGDTPHDIACAQIVGARAVGVATGSYSLQQLKDSGADEVFEDLSDTEAFLKLL